MSETLNITPSPRLLEVLGDIPMDPWQCVAELIDNSIDELNAAQKEVDDPRIDVDVEKSDGSVFMTVTDNGRGMHIKELEKALSAGYSGKGRYGTLGLFGMGFNIATARMGQITEVRTTKMGDDEWISTVIDFRQLQRQENFLIPVERRKKSLPSEHGTSVRVKLKRDFANKFVRDQFNNTIREKLGHVYSYMLRDTIPGLANVSERNLFFSNRIPIKINYLGSLIQPKLPCIWSSERSVTVRGQEISAAQVVDAKLTNAWICLDCGNWHRNVAPEACEECESRNIHEKERRVFGWLGVSRFLHTTDFGIDFIRHGRKILVNDKSVFVWTDPDTLFEDAEYPVEMPQNYGRLVGEIHLDHVPVPYQKNDFDRSTRDWRVALEQVRGSSPLKPKKSKGLEPNNSPLAKLYSGFRRNDPGIKCLIPGDGNKATHQVSITWGRYFHQGQGDYYTDEKWYQAAERHDTRKANQARGKGAGNDGADDGSVGKKLFGSEVRDGDPQQVSPPKESLTISEKIQRYKSIGEMRDEVCGVHNIPRGGQWQIDIWTTRSKILNEKGNEEPAVCFRGKGNHLTVFVNDQSSLITEFGRSFKDIALYESAAVVQKELKDPSYSISSLVQLMLKSFEDEKISEAFIKQRADVFLQKFRDLAEEVVANDADRFWDSLSSEQKMLCEREASSREQPLGFKWDTVVSSGQFAQFCPLSVLQHLVNEFPQDFFEGRVFKPAWTAWHDEKARQTVLDKVNRALSYVDSFSEDPIKPGGDEILHASMYLDELSRKLADN